MFALHRCGDPRFGQAQIWDESAKSGTVTVACMDSALLLTSFPLVLSSYYSQVLNKMASDIYHQCYVRADKSWTALARVCEVC